MTADPFKDANRKDDKRTQIEGLEIAQVVGVPDTQDHNVVVRAASVQDGSTASTPETATVVASTSGDVSLPTEGDLVLVARTIGNTAVVVGTVYGAAEDVPTYTPGDRIIGHGATDSSITISENGDVLVNGSQVGGASDSRVQMFARRRVTG
jgi:hypothetical protein